MSWVDAALLVGAFLVSLSVHECAHAWTALRLGDSTGHALGRVSLNPIRHIDPVGTVLLPLVLVLGTYSATGRYGTPFGYAKPVPYNPYVLRNPAVGMALISGAGPLSNVALAVGSAGLLGILSRSGGYESTLGLRFFEVLVLVNVQLAIFNLIPIAPLDGAGILAGLLPRGAANVMRGVERYGFLLLIALMATGLLGRVVGPVQSALLDPLSILAGRPLGG